MITNSTLIDNSSDTLKMVSVVEDLIDSQECNMIKIATGYWDIPSTALLLDHLKRFLQRENTKVQILIGSAPVVRASQQKNIKYKGAITQTDFIRCDLQKLEVKDEYVETVKLLKEFCLSDFDSSRIQIKMYGENQLQQPQFFHAQSYIFLGNNFAKGIVGSSNFTQKGLEVNSELNYLEWNNAIVTAVPNANSDTKGHNYWFNEKWEMAEPWNRTFLKEVLKGCPVEECVEEIEEEQAKPLTPYELYIKLLNYKFGDIVDLNQQELLKNYLPKNYDVLEYQLQAVRQYFAIMHEHGGFM